MNAFQAVGDEQQKHSQVKQQLDLQCPINAIHVRNSEEQRMDHGQIGQRREKIDGALGESQEMGDRKGQGDGSPVGGIQPAGSASPRSPLGG